MPVGLRLRQKPSHLSDARHLRLRTGSPRRTSRVCGRTCDPSPADRLSQRRAQEGVVVSDRPCLQASPDQSAVVAIEPRGGELAKIYRTEVGLRLLREQFVAEEGLRGETAGVSVLQEGVQQMPNRSLGRAGRAVCHLGQQLGGRLVRRPFRAPNRPADLRLGHAHVSWVRPDAISICGMDYGMGLAVDSKSPGRRDGRADECDGLENRWVISPVGSNPTPSAIWQNHNVLPVQRLSHEPRLCTTNGGCTKNREAAPKGPSRTGPRSY